MFKLNVVAIVFGEIRQLRECRVGAILLVFVDNRANFPTHTMHRSTVLYINYTQLGMTFTYLPLKFFTPEVNIFSSFLVNIFTTEVNFQDLPPGFKIKNLVG